MNRSIESSRHFQLNGIRIRTATLADAAAIAQVHVQSWHETYRGLVPDELLAALSVARNTRMWHEIIERADIITMLATREDNAAKDGDVDQPTVVGLGSAGRASDRALGAEGEVTAIYLLEQVKRRGIGRGLLDQLLHALAAHGHRSAGLWVLVGNDSARRFYEAAGARTGATREVTHSTAVLREVAYVWDDLSVLVPSP